MNFRILGTFSTSKKRHQRNQILFKYLRDKKKRKKGGQKRGVKIHPFHLPWIRPCNNLRFYLPEEFLLRNFKTNRRSFVKVVASENSGAFLTRHVLSITSMASHHRQNSPFSTLKVLFPICNYPF